MRKKPITVKSFLAKWLGMSTEEQELVIELLNGTKLFAKSEEKELEKYRSLEARGVVEIKEDKSFEYCDLARYWVSLKEYE